MQAADRYDALARGWLYASTGNLDSQSSHSTVLCSFCKGTTARASHRHPEWLCEYDRFARSKMSSRFLQKSKMTRFLQLSLTYARITRYLTVSNATDLKISGLQI